MLNEMMDLEANVNRIIGTQNMNEQQFLNSIKVALDSQIEFVDAVVNCYSEVVKTGQDEHPDFDRFWHDDKQKLDKSMIALLGITLSYFCFYRFDQNKIVRMYTERINLFCAKVKLINFIVALQNLFKGI